MTKHFVLADVQAKPGVSLEHLTHIGDYILDKKPDVIVCIGDFADMESLSSYDKGKKSFEGRRYKADIAAAKEAMDLLLGPIRAYNKQQKANKQKQYKPRMVMTLGNHEQRISRVTEDSPELDGVISYDDLPYQDWEVHDFLKPVEIDGFIYCLSPEHKLLMKDLSYKKLREIKAGETLLAFDEEAREGETYRKYRESTVEKIDLSTAEMYEVILSNGDTFKTTGDHQWLVRFNSTKYEWVSTLDILKRDTREMRTRFLKLFNKWDSDVLKHDPRDVGWLGGIFDGEGYLCRANCKQGGIQLRITQNKGVVLDKIMRLLKEFGIKAKAQSKDGKCYHVIIYGTTAEKLEFLSYIGSERLIQNLNINTLGRVQSPDNFEEINLVSIKSIGIQEMVMIKTSTGTMIADGYAHHNCHYLANPMSGKPYSGTALNQLVKVGKSFVVGHKQTLDIATRYLIGGQQQWGFINGSAYTHQENYKGYQGNDHFRGCLMLHEVKNGTCNPMVLSLDYLKMRYEKTKKV